MDRRSSLASLDVALDYLHLRLATLGPLYVLAVLPLAGAMLFAIDVITTQRWALAPMVSVALILAIIWRWIVQAIMQRRVQMELSGQEVQSVWRRLGPILFGRLLANVAMTWGSCLILPGIWGLFASGFVTPAALTPSGSVKDG